MLLRCTLVLIYVHLSFGLIVDKQVTPDSLINKFYTRFEEFGFDVGGTVEISGRTSNNTTAIKLYVCDELDYRERLTRPTWSQFCEQNSPKIPFIPLNGRTYSFQIPTKGRYYFGIIDCRHAIEPYFRADLHYVLLNPDGSQLPLGQALLPYIESTFTGLWTLLLLVYSVFLVKDREYVTPIHYILFGVVASRLIVSIINTGFWWNYALFGREKTYLDQLSFVMFALAEGAFLMAMYLMSKGWRITRTGVPSSDFRATGTAIGILVITLSFFSFYNGEYYFLTLLILYFFVMPKIFSGLTVQTSQLDHQVRVWNQLPMQNIVDVISSLVRKRYMLRQARHCATMHILLVLSSTVGIKALVPWFYSWIMTLTSHISIWTVIAYLCFASRPMRGVFFTSMEQLLPFITAQQFADNRDDGEGEDALRPWDLTKTLVIEWPAPREKTNTLNVSIGYDAAYHEQQKAS